MKIKAIFFLLLTSFSAYTQNLSKQDALKDFEYLNNAVINGHPVNYNPTHQVNINEIVLALRNLQNDSISNFEYSIFLGKALQKVGDIHTSVLSNPLASKTESYCPEKLYILNEKLYIVADSGNVNIGKEAIEINGIKAQEIVNIFSNIRAADGGSTNFSQQYFNRFSQTLIAQFFNSPTNYIIQTEQNTITVNASKSEISTPKDIIKGNYILDNKENNFNVINNVGILKITSFYKSDIHFLKSVFTYMNGYKISNLVVDLRGNLGGNRNSVAFLTKQLIDTSFSYSIIQPKLKPAKFLTSKGKLFLALSKLKYNIADFYLGHKTPLGREFIYKTKVQKNNYKGRLFVITDGFTASASTMFTSWIKQYTDATFIGSQAGGGYNGNGGGSFPIIQLPNSKMKIQFPVYRLVLDKNSKMYQGIVPQIQPIKTIQDILQNNDVDIVTIFKLINSPK